MAWLLEALGSVLANSALFYCFKRLGSKYPIIIYLFYTWLVASIILGALILTNDFSLSFWGIFIVIVAGISSWLGNYFYNLSLSKETNLGYIEAVSSIRIVLSYIASLLLFQNEFQPIKLISLFGIFFGVFLISYTNGRRVSKGSWILYALLAGFFYAIIAICVVYARHLEIQAPVFTCMFLVVATSLYWITAHKANYSFAIKADILYIALAGVVAATGSYLLFLSYQNAPNIAYSVAISNCRVIALYVINLFTLKKRPDFVGILSVIIITISVITLSL